MTVISQKTTRRSILIAGTSLIAGGAAAVATRSQMRRGDLRPTPRQVEGPYYPGAPIKAADSDLVENGPVPARGIPVILGGRILNPAGSPIQDATVEIWQCDAAGVYHHPRDRGEADANFQGFGRALSRHDGSYLFRAIRPVPYGTRTPHIHFKVEALGYRPLTTQLYVAEEKERNARDPVYEELDPAAAAAVTTSFAAAQNGQLRAIFDIILDKA